MACYLEASRSPKWPETCSFHSWCYERPPVGGDWIHEIKHDGYRLMVRRDGVGVLLLTRNGKDWTARFPAVLDAASGLKARSCLIDGEAVACDGNGVAVFERLGRKHEAGDVFLYAFDLLPLPVF